MYLPPLRPPFNPSLIPPISVITEHRAELLVLYRSFLLAINFTHGSVYIWRYMYNYQSPNSSQPLFSLCVHTSAFYTCISLPALQIGPSVYHFSRIHILCVNIYLFFSFWLTSLCMTVSRSNSINDPILFLLWLSDIPLYICTTSSLSIHM